MPTALQITKRLAVTPLIDIQDAAFASSYSNGLWWSLYGDHAGVKPLPDCYLVDNLKRDASKGFFDGQHDNLLSHLGFYFGMVHGGILSPRTGKLCPNATALVTFGHPDAARGYAVARRDCFYYAAPESGIDTDTKLLQELCTIARDLQDYPDDGTCWYYSIGCILGNLSVLLFPATAQEWRQWEAEHYKWQEQQKPRPAQACDTEPLAPVPVIQYTV